MKVYVDELPKSCCECIYWDENWGCNIGNFNKKTCPLQSLSDYTKQVRKEVLDELCNMLTDKAVLIETGGVAEFMFTTYDLQESIKQIQGEGNVENN